MKTMRELIESGDVTLRFDPKSGKTMLRCNHQNCSYSTDKNSNFQRHLKTMHVILPPELQPTCCDSGFVTKGDYRFHTKTVHAEGHKCNICVMKVFNRKALLKRHMSSHNGCKPFACPFCSYRSANKSNVLRHLPKHNPKPNTKTAKLNLRSNRSDDGSSPCSSHGANVNVGLRSLVSMSTSSSSSRSSPSTSTSTSTSASTRHSHNSPALPESPQDLLPPQSKLPLSHSIQNILSPKTGMKNDSSLFVPDATKAVVPLPVGNQLKTNDTTTTATDANWSQLSSSRQRDGLALQLHDYRTDWSGVNNGWANQLQFPLFGHVHSSYYNSYLNYNNPHYPYPIHSFATNNDGGLYYNYNQGYYNQHNITAPGDTAQSGGDLLPRTDEETRRNAFEGVQVHHQAVPEFLLKPKPLKRKGASAETLRHFLMNEQSLPSSSLSSPSAPVHVNVALLPNEGINHGGNVLNAEEAENGDAFHYVPKKLRLTKRYGNGQ